MADALLLVSVVVVVLFLSVLVRGTEHKPPRLFIVVSGPKTKTIPRGATTMTIRTTMSEPENTPFPHEHECKMKDAEPTWYPIGEGHYERVCTCRKEVSYPPMWRRPDILDPAVMQHNPSCSIADKPDLLKVAVKVKQESTYDFATCGVCSHNWYAHDAPPVEAASR